MTFEIKEHKSSGYAPRTYHNASVGDLTVAFAVDFTTAGEKLTKKAAGSRFVSIDIGMSYIETARILYKACKKHDVKVLNIAGNGIYTLEKRGMDQHSVNMYLYSILSLIEQHWPLKGIVSGGQTGIDLAGGVCAKYLGIPCTMMLPLGYKQRFSNGVDITQSCEDVMKQVEYWVSKIDEEVS